jgi:CheY-like chemotaxis protein
MSDASPGDAPRPEAVDVGELLHSLATLLAHGFDARIRIKVDAPSTCAPVWADPARLEAALLMLTARAREAMPNGGLLQLVCDSQRGVPDSVRATLGGADAGAGADAGLVAIEVIHNGPHAHRQGLDDVHDFARRAGGAALAVSSATHGHAVTLFLPQAGHVLMPNSEPTANEERLPAGSRVLLVDDDAGLRRTLSGLLRQLGCDVTLAADADEALRCLRHGDAFALLISDIALGAGLRGTQLAGEARALEPSLPVLLISGYSGELVKADAATPSDFELLRKPFGRVELVRAMVGATTRALRAREP